MTAMKAASAIVLLGIVLSLSGCVHDSPSANPPIENENSSSDAQAEINDEKDAGNEAWQIVIQAYGKSNKDDSVEIEETLSRNGFDTKMLDDAGYDSPGTKTLVIVEDENALSTAYQIADIMGLPSSRVFEDRGGYRFEGDVLILVGMR